MSWVAVGVTAANLAFKVGTSIHQNRQRKELEEKMGADPIYQIPQAATDALNLAKSQVMSRDFAGQTQAEQRLDRNVANSTSDILRAGTSSGDVLASLTQLNANSQGLEGDMAFFAANDFQDRQNNLQNQLGVYAGYQDTKQQKDVYDKYFRDAAAISALRYGAMTNASNTGQYAESSANTYAPMIQDWFKNKQA